MDYRSKLFKQGCCYCFEIFYLSVREVEEGADLNFCCENCRRLFFEANTNK